MTTRANHVVDVYTYTLTRLFRTKGACCSVVIKMPPKKENSSNSSSGSGKLTKEEERLLLESSRQVTRTTSALFYGNAFIVSALPLCKQKIYIDKALCTTQSSVLYGSTILIMYG